MTTGLVQDVRYAIRSIARRPSGSAAVFLTFALGIGVTTILLTVVDQILIRPLVYEDSGRLYSVWGVADGSDAVQPSYPDFLDWREASEGLALTFAFGDVLSFGGADGATQVPTAFVSDGFFEVLHTRPLLGRAFEPDEERRGDPVVILSHGFWVARLGSRSDVVGTTIDFNGTAHTVVGVTPVGFAWPEWADVWVPLDRLVGTNVALGQRDARVDTRALARLEGGVSLDAANAQMRMVASDLAARYPETNRGLSLRLSPLQDEVVGEVRSTLFVMLAAAGLVLLIACANVAGLLLARTAGRSRELAVRAALGASGRRIVRQLLIESLILGSVGGALGVAAAMIGLDLLSGWAGATLAQAGIPVPRLKELGVDLRAVAIAAGMTLSAALLLGLAPASRAVWGDPILGLRQVGRGGGHASFRVLGTLAGVQVALAVALLGTYGLLNATLRNLRSRPPGFDSARLVTLRVFPPPSYETANERLALYDGLAERVSELPGVSGVALTNHMELAGGVVVTPIRSVTSPADSAVTARYRTVSPGFFEVSGMPILRGREFQPPERASPVVVINEALAAALWRSDPAVGHSILVTNPTPPSERRGEVFEATVVGVVADTPDSPREPAVPKVYVPHAYDPWGNITIVVRGEGDPAALVPSIREGVREVEPTIPVANVQPLLESVRGATMREMVIGATMGGFAAIAFVLSLVGVYGALENMVRKRFDEFGIRMAMGATPRRIQRNVLGRAIVLLAPALVVGAAGAVALGHLLRGLLFGVPPTHVASLLFAVLTITSVGLFAAWVPALRAARINPAALVRSD